MNKTAKKLLVLFLALLLGGYFGVYSVQAQDDKLILKTSKECDIQYTGNNCVAELKLTNNVGEILDGTASLHIDYQGACSNNKLENFDGVGITAQFSINNVDWLNFSGWENGITTVSGFNINKDGTQPKLKIETVPNLCLGEYTFALSVKGTFEEEEYIAPTVAVGGGGGIVTQTSTLSATAQKVDANKDNKIDVLDFNTLMVNWGNTSVGNVADFNGDGKVDVFDFNLLMINWTL